MDRLVGLVNVCLTAKTLAERMSAGDELVCELSPRLLLFIRGRIPKDSAEDVLQDTLERIFRFLETFNGKDDDNFWSWSYKIARMKVADFFRVRKITKVTIVDPDVFYEACEGYERTDRLSKDDLRDLEEALEIIAKSDPRCAKCLKKYYLEELTFKALGDDLNMREDAARQQFNRCMRRARVLVRNKF